MCTCSLARASITLRDWAQALILCRLWPAAAAAVQTLRSGSDADYIAAQLMWRSGDVCAAVKRLRNSTDARGERPAKCGKLLALLEPWQDMDRQGSEAVADGKSGGTTVLLLCSAFENRAADEAAASGTAVSHPRNACSSRIYFHPWKRQRPAVLGLRRGTGRLVLCRQTGSQRAWRHAPRCCAPSRSTPPAAWRRCSCVGAPRRCARCFAYRTP